MKHLIPQGIKNIYHLAKANLAAFYYHHPAHDLTIIGVTGTDGKTTTATIIHHLLNSAGKKVALVTSVAAYIGDQQLNTGFHVTSPDPWPLQKLLSQVNSQEINYLVLEVTSHGLDQHRLAGIHFHTAVLTNISHEHLDYHRTFENYVKAKSKLFTHAKVAILNHDDQSSQVIKKTLKPSTKTISYSASSLKPNLAKATKQRFKEKFNQQNATAAITTAKQFHIEDDQIIKAISTSPPIPGRMQSIKNKFGINIVIDFAHTPNALESALRSLKKTFQGRLIAVYGSAGQRDYQKRPLMGKIGAHLADEVILTAEDPRKETAWSIIDQMMSGIKKNHGHIHKIPDRQQAINFAIKLARKGDTVGIFGKGHEQSMCFGTIEQPWSDQAAVDIAINKRKSSQ